MYLALAAIWETTSSQALHTEEPIVVVGCFLLPVVYSTYHYLRTSPAAGWCPAASMFMVLKGYGSIVFVEVVGACRRVRIPVKRRARAASYPPHFVTLGPVPT